MRRFTRADGLFHAPVTRRGGLHAREDHRAGAHALEGDRRNGNPQHGAQVQFELIEVLRPGQRHHARVVRPGRQLGEIDPVVAAQKELHAPQSGPGEGFGDGGGHALRLGEVFGCDHGRLETLAVVAALLHMADRRAEKRRAVLLGDGQQRDLAVEADELLDDQFADVAARPFAAVMPGAFQLVGTLDQRLPLARRGHQRLDHAGEADFRGGLAQFAERCGVEIPRRLQPQFLRREVADGLAVHREIHGPGARYDLDARPLELVEPFGADGLDLGNDDVGAVFCDRSGQRVAVEHVEDLRGVGHLHRGSARILVARHDGLSQPLRRNRELLAQLAGTQKKNGFHISM